MQRQCLGVACSQFCVAKSKRLAVNVTGRRATLQEELSTASSSSSSIVMCAFAWWHAHVQHSQPPSVANSYRMHMPDATEPTLAAFIPTPLQLNDWFLKSRDPETGAFPDLPDASKGGSKCILRPPPPQPTTEEAAALAAAKEKEEKSKKSGGAKGGKGKGEVVWEGTKGRCSCGTLQGQGGMAGWLAGCATRKGTVEMQSTQRAKDSMHPCAMNGRCN